MSDQDTEEMSDQDTEVINPRIVGFVRGIPPLTMGWLSGMFAAVWTGVHSDPAVGPQAAGVFAIITGAAALGFTYLHERGRDE